MAGWIVKVILSALAGVLADWLAGTAAGTCPSTWSVVICSHWVGVSTALKVLAGLLDPKRAAAPVIAKVEQAAALAPRPRELPEPPVRLVPADELDAEAQAEIEKLRGPG